MGTPTKHMVSASEAKLHFGEILNKCVYGKTPVYIKKHDKPVAVIVSMEEWKEEKENPVIKENLHILGEVKRLWKLQTASRSRLSKRKKIPTNAQILREIRQERDKKLFKE